VLENFILVQGSSEDFVSEDGYVGILSEKSREGSNGSDVFIPDGTGVFAWSDIPISGAPAGVVVTKVDVDWQVYHQWPPDVVVVVSDYNVDHQYTLWNREFDLGPYIGEMKPAIKVFNGEPVNQIWTLWAADFGAGDAGIIDYWWIKVYYEDPFSYCDASGGCGYEHIKDVIVGDIVNTGTGCDYYSDYTSMSTTMEIGTGYAITVVNGDPYDEDQCGIWVDWDQDFDFDDSGESIPVTGSPGKGPYTATITPPAGAKLGKTRMRIRLRYTGSLSPCGDTSYGEVEDYSINVVAAPDYCAAQGGTGCGHFIMNFKLKTIDNESSCSPYSDYTAISTDLEKGTSYPFVVRADWATYCAMWVDWNQDKDFDDTDEEIETTYFYFKEPPYSGETLFTQYHIGMITPPEGAPLGARRLRIRTSSSSSMSSCGDTADGEVEDYTIVVTESGMSGEETYGGGCGTEAEPFLIYTADQMQAIGENDHHWGKQFKLMADIDLGGYIPNTFNIIGNHMFKFRGVFDGNGHTISNFTYSATDEHRIGIFGEVSDSNAVIKDLGVEDPNVQAQGGEGIGALVGILRQGTVTGCYVAGGGVTGSVAVGGLVGGNHATIENCYSIGNLFGYDKVGGLIGYMLSGQVKNCYSAASVSGQSAFGYGGLIGCVTDGTTVNSFWDMDICTNSAGGTGKTTTEMQMMSTYTDVGWDFSTPVWKICEGTNYPKLASEVPPAGDFFCPDGVDLFDFSFFACHWMEKDCGQCGGAELTGDGNVDVNDLEVFAVHWLEGT